MVSKSRKQFMVSSILPKNEQNSLSWASSLLRRVKWSLKTKPTKVLFLHYLSIYLPTNYILMPNDHFCSTGQFPVENLRGLYKMKKKWTHKKLVSFGTFKLIPYLHKNQYTMNFPVQDAIRQKWVFWQMQCGHLNSCIQVVFKRPARWFKLGRWV